MTGKTKRPELRVVYPPKRAKILPEDFQEPTLQYLLLCCELPQPIGNNEISGWSSGYPKSLNKTMACRTF